MGEYADLAAVGNKIYFWSKKDKKIYWMYGKCEVDGKGRPRSYHPGLVHILSMAAVAILETAAGAAAGLHPSQAAAAAYLSCSILFGLTVNSYIGRRTERKRRQEGRVFDPADPGECTALLKGVKYMGKTNAALLIVFTSMTLALSCFFLDVDAPGDITGFLLIPFFWFMTIFFVKRNLPRCRGQAVKQLEKRLEGRG